MGLHEYDVATQGLISHHVTFLDGSITHWSVPFRYTRPAELDLMAQLAGMSLRERWSGWKREPFTSDSREQHMVPPTELGSARAAGVTMRQAREDFCRRVEAELFDQQPEERLWPAAGQLWR